MKSFISFNNESSVKIVPFDSMESLVSMTAPYLENGMIGLSCGNTYAALFPLWAAASPDCSSSSFFPVDERVVPFSDTQSNWGTVYERLLKPLKKEHDKAHLALTEQAYTALLTEHFKTTIPVFDVIFLGVGDDGHTASLFPGGSYLNNLTSTVLQTTSPKPPYTRITLGMAPLIAAKKVLVIIAGIEKKQILAKVLLGDPTLPIVQVLSKRESSVIFVEKELL